MCLERIVCSARCSSVDRSFAPDINKSLNYRETTKSLRIDNDAYHKKRTTPRFVSLRVVAKIAEKLAPKGK